MPLPAGGDDACLPNLEPKQPAGCTEASLPERESNAPADIQYHDITTRRNFYQRTHRTAWIVLSIIALSTTVWSCPNYPTRPRRIDATRYSPGIRLTPHSHYTPWIFVARFSSCRRRKIVSHTKIAHICQPWRERKPVLRLNEDDQAQAARADLANLAKRLQKRLEGVVEEKRQVRCGCATSISGAMS
jgi:hypothetical protein